MERKTRKDKVAECEYCGTKQTVPNPDNEKKVNLFNRANRLRMASEFDKAAGIYESIIAEFPEEAEAYWGICLCNYGIEYVDDPATAKKIPTCHRASFESLQKDENFELALEYADVVAQKIYRDEAREIDHIMQEILAVSKNEKPYDVFICYKETDEKGERTVDSVLAYDIYETLTAKGYNVFFSRVTLEDKLGMQYEPYIFAALNSAKVMLSVGTKYEYFHAVWVKNEWSRFLKLMAKDKSKVLIPCYKDIDAYDMPEEFKALQAQDLGKLGAVQDIVRGVEKIIPKNESAQVKETVVVSQSGGPNVEALLKRGNNALEDGNFSEAKTHFDKVLDINAECAEAYLGLVLAENKVSNEKDFIFSGKIYDKNYIRAKKYADTALLDRLTNFENIIKKKYIDNIGNILIHEKYCLIAAGYFHTVGLYSDGTVVAVGDNKYGKCDVRNWTDIIAISAGFNHTVGLKSDGTVVAVGDNKYGECDVRNWTDIVAIKAAACHTIGLKSNGTVVAVGWNGKEQCDVNSWSDIVAISAGKFHTIGLKSDGTVVAVGENNYGQCDVNNWSDIVAISACETFTVGLRSNGTVVAVGRNDKGQCNVSDWLDIVAISANCKCTVGLKSDSTVVTAGNNNGRKNVSDWTNIVAISTNDFHTVGLKSDGTVFALGINHDGQCDVSKWKLFDDFENIEEERKCKMAEKTKQVAEAKRLEEEKRRIAEQKAEEKRKLEEQKSAYREKGVCQHCGGTLKGFILKKCTNCGKVKDY